MEKIEAPQSINQALYKNYFIDSATHLKFLLLFMWRQHDPCEDFQVIVNECLPILKHYKTPEACVRRWFATSNIKFEDMLKLIDQFHGEFHIVLAKKGYDTVTKEENDYSLDIKLSTFSTDMRRILKGLVMAYYHNVADAAAAAHVPCQTLSELSHQSRSRDIRFIELRNYLKATGCDWDCYIFDPLTGEKYSYQTLSKM